MFDAYTVKKVFPRLAIAVVLIQLSWPLFTFMIFVVSQIAWGVEGLMYAPFGGRDAFNLGSMVGTAVNAGNQGGGGSPELLIGALLGATGVIGYGIALGPVGLLTLGVTVLLAVLVAFFVLAVRQVVIVVLLVLSPIALVAWILPNTEKIWKLWWESFSKLLFMYPLILMLIAGGKIGAYIAAQVAAGSSTNDAFGMAIVIVVFFAPYFLIPKTFQLAGSAFANIAGIANNKSRGAFDRLKKFRGNRMAQRGAAARAGELFNSDRLNALTSRATTRNFGFGRRGRSAYSQKQDLAAAEHAKSAQGQAAQFNDHLLRAQTYGSAAEARENMGRDFGMSDEQVESAIAAARANGGFGRARQIYAAKQLATTGTGYDNIEQVRQTVARASGGNEETIASLAGNINSTSKTVGRYDLAPGFSTLNNLSRNTAGLPNAPAGAPIYGPPNPIDVGATVDAARGVDVVTLLRGKPAQVENLTQSLGSHLNSQWQRANDATLTDAERAEATDEVLRTTAQIEQLNQAKGYASSQNQEHVNTLLDQTATIRGALVPRVSGPTPPPPGTAGPILPAGDLHERWTQLNPPTKSPNDPNLPTI